jgi:uncharacterized RDD family membrane protein YckC
MFRPCNSRSGPWLFLTGSRLPGTVARVDDTAKNLPSEYAGARLGYPLNGSGSVASWLRRVAALFIDWFASQLVARFVFGPEVWANGPEQLAVFAIFIAETAVLTALVGGSFGQLAVRIAVVRLDGTRLDLLRAVLRSALICLVIPAVVFNRDNRGLHDLAVGSVVVER